MLAIFPLVPEKHRPTVAESLADLVNYNLLQPPAAGAAVGAGAKVRQRQWQALSGRVLPANLVPIVGGACFGMMVGALLGFALLQEGGVPETLGAPLMVVLALLCAPVGSFAAMRFLGRGAYYAGMMMVVLNERRNLIDPAMVTAQAEAYVPKSLLAWRSYDWRYQRGQPYLWTHYPIGERLPNRPLTTADYLFNENDNYRARDVAVYARRNINREVSENAETFLDADTQNTEEGENRLVELLPWLSPIALPATGLLIFIMSTG